MRFWDHKLGNGKTEIMIRLSSYNSAERIALVDDDEAEVALAAAGAARWERWGDRYAAAKNAIELAIARLRATDDGMRTMCSDPGTTGGSSNE